MLQKYGKKPIIGQDKHTLQAEVPTIMQLLNSTH